MEERERASWRWSNLLKRSLEETTHRLTVRASEFGEWLTEARERVPVVVDEVRLFARHPRALASLIEERSQWLARRFMGVASNVAEPFTLGMGFRVERFEEDRVEVVMPGGWRNRGEGGRIHSGALSVLGETTVRMYLDYHLDLQHASFDVRRVQVRIFASPEGEMKGVFRLPEEDREAILHRLRTEFSVPLETETRIYDHVGRLMAEVEIEWRLTRQLTLGSGSIKPGDSRPDEK